MPWQDDLAATVGKAVFSSFKDKARQMMVEGAEKRGLDWTGVVKALEVTNNSSKLSCSRASASIHNLGADTCLAVSLSKYKVAVGVRLKSPF